MLFILCITQHIFAGCDDGESVYFYNRIPGCGCFDHCTCFSHYIGPFSPGLEYLESDAFPSDKPSHPKRPEDILWHEFMKGMLRAKKEGPFIIWDRSSFKYKIGYGDKHDLCMLNEYLDCLESFKKLYQSTRIKLLADAEKMYPSKRDVISKEAEINKINTKAIMADKILDELSDKIIPLYKNILSSCPHEHQTHNMAFSYNLGLISFIEGNWEIFAINAERLVQLAEINNEKRLLNSGFYQKFGESKIEVGLYHDAIKILSEAIAKDPNNKEAYFQRSVAYFETGDFDQAILDFLYSGHPKILAQIQSKTSKEFEQALLSGLVEGGAEAAIDFAPSLCSSAYGLSECLWAFAEHPIDGTVNFSNICYEVGTAIVNTIKNCDQKKLEEISREMRRFAQEFDCLSDGEKGHCIGHCIGKYGVDCFAGGALVKCVSAVKKLRDANRICNLEALTISEPNKKFITATAIKHAEDREAFFRNVKLHHDKQNKHIPGKHNYVKGKSILEHKDPERLLKEFAGKGTPLGDRIPGLPDYRERVNFREFIGYHVDEFTEIKTPTTWGEIRYSNSSAHIFPAFPE